LTHGQERVEPRGTVLPAKNGSVAAVELVTFHHLLNALTFGQIILQEIPMEPFFSKRTVPLPPLCENRSEIIISPKPINGFFC